MPLNFTCPKADLPIVPIFLNFLAPPVPPARRYLKVGGIVRRIIEEWDEDMRVAVIATGHMTNVARAGDRTGIPQVPFARCRDGETRR